MEKKSCGYLRCANRVGLFLLILYAICFVWHYVSPGDSDLRVKLFQMAFFGFSGMNFLSFVLGAFQVYVWAYVGVGIWYLVGCCHARGDECQKA